MAVQRPEAEERLPESEALARELDELDTAIAELKAHYEQYFLGVERHPPSKAHADTRQRLAKLRGGFIRSAVLKFRIQALQQKFTTYDRLWQRTLTEMENGTYRRDLFKARRRRRSGEVQAADGRAKPGETAPAPVPPAGEAAPPPAVAAPVPSPISSGTEGVAGRKGPVPTVAPVAIPPGTQGGVIRIPSGTQGGVTRPPPAPLPTGKQAAVNAAAAAALAEPRLRAVYDAYLAAKKSCREDTSRISFETVADSLRKQVPELLERHGARDVEYKVVVKDGKAVLRAVPKG